MTLSAAPAPALPASPSHPADAASIPAEGAAVAGRLARLKWPLLAALLALVPVSGVFSLDRVFCVRDLSLFFWGRQLFLRRALLSGHWPLWDPYLGGGQSAVADGLHQMFLLPVLALRLLGTEVVGFNLWVALPFPMAALGAWLFLRRRFSAPASAFGAIAFAVSGPVVSTGNFPNLSWSVAAMPWVMWAVEHCLEAPSPRSAVRLALAFGFQALSGEPVTLTATGLVALVYALVCAWPARRETSLPSALASVVGGLVLGGLLSAVQMVPMAEAVRNSWRPYGATTDFWSLHPLALAETLSVHLTGDYFESVNFLALPWMLPLNSGRDPFFFSIYLGTTLLAVALFGALAGGRRVPIFFWVAVLVAALLAAFGPHTPFYPFLRAHAPLVGSFRFPVKYLLVAVLALSVLVAAGWDAMTAGDRERSSRRHRVAQWSGPALALAIAAVAYVLSALALYFPATAVRQYFDLANWVGIRDPVAAARFMLGSLPAATSRVVLLSLACALFLAVGSSKRREARPARMALLFLLAVDLTTSAWGINATFEAKYLQDPAWTSIVRQHPETRFYFGGKVDGTLREKDPDGAMRFRREPGLSPVEARSALANEPVFFPAARQVRELFSFDLAVLWPRAFQTAHSRFLVESREARQHFLDNAGVRFRMLPAGRGEGHPSVGGTRYCERMQLFDWGPGVNRASVVTTPLLVPDARREIDGMFDPAFDARRTVMVASVPAVAAGIPGSPLPASARILSESNDVVRLEAAVPAAGGYLVLLDTYTPDWKARVDGVDAEVVRANALFRAIRLAPGRHSVEFRFRPRAFYYGAALSLVAVLLCAMGWRRPAAPAAASSGHAYDEVFYSYIESGARASAARIVPIVVRDLAPSSVLDVGCGAGAWLAAYRGAGVEDVTGIDGDYVRRERLLIPAERFQVHDLSQPFDLGKRFGLVQCLEVAEHLPPASSRGLVASLVAHGDCVLFSAAIPGQGGEHHVNEQPLEYWRSLFAEQGFLAFDAIRPEVADCDDVEPWYRYNTLLYVRASAVGGLPARVRDAAVEDRASLSATMPLGYRFRIAIVRRLPVPAVTWLATQRARWIVSRGQGHGRS